MESGGERLLGRLNVRRQNVRRPDMAQSPGQVRSTRAFGRILLGHTATKELSAATPASICAQKAPKIEPGTRGLGDFHDTRYETGRCGVRGADNVFSGRCATASVGA